MDIQWLITFKTITEVGSYTKAAEKLGYAPSTLVNQIHQLEKELSVNLFDKVGQRIQLSVTGASVLPMVEQMLYSAECLRQSCDKTSKNLRIILSAGICEKQVYQAMARVLSENHDIESSIIRRPCSDCMDLIKAKIADIGIIYQKRGSEDSELEIVPLMDVPMTLVASARKEREWNCVTQQLAGEIPFYVNQPKCAFFCAYQEYLQERKLESGKPIVMGEVDMIIQAVIDGLGISLLPSCIVKPYIESKKLKEIQMPGFVSNIYIAMISRKGEKLNLPEKRFCSIMLQQEELSTFV